MESGTGHRPARHRGPLTPQRIPLVLVSHLEARARKASHYRRQCKPSFIDSQLRTAGVPEKSTGDPFRSAVEEYLRLESPVSDLSQSLTKSIELLDQKLEEGSRIHLFYASANRNEAILPEPDPLRPGRYPNPHLALGIGDHFCLGAALARIELRVGLQDLLAFPEL